MFRTASLSWTAPDRALAFGIGGLPQALQILLTSEDAVSSVVVCAPSLEGGRTDGGKHRRDRLPCSLLAKGPRCSAGLFSQIPDRNTPSQTSEAKAIASSEPSLQAVLYAL